MGKAAKDLGKLEQSNCKLEQSSKRSEQRFEQAYESSGSSGRFFRQLDRSRQAYNKIWAVCVF